MIYDLKNEIRGISVAGLDISEYAINNAMGGYANWAKKNLNIDSKKAKKLEEKAAKYIKPHMVLGSAEKLPWPDNSFDVILSINTSHNLPESKLVESINEMNRVCRNPKNMFMQVDGYKNQEEGFILTNETIGEEYTQVVKVLNSNKVPYDTNIYFRMYTYSGGEALIRNLAVYEVAYD